MVVRVLTVMFLLLATAASAEPLLVTDARIATLKQNTKLVRSLSKKCDKELLVAAHALADFAPQPHYSSQGANPDDDQAKALTGDVRAAYREALCYRLSGNNSYAQHAQTLIDAWALTMKSASNAQGAADINFNIAQMIVAASWVENANGWNTKPFAQWLQSVIAPLSRADKPNNHGNWGVLLDLSIALFTHDHPLLNKSYLRWTTLLEQQVASDGSLPLEICRSNSSDHCGGPDKGINGLAYTHFALLPALLGAELLQGAGIGAYQTPAGQKMLQALRLSATFTANPSSFPFYATNQGKLNKIDHCGHFALMLHHVADANAQAVINSGVCKSDIWQLLILF